MLEEAKALANANFAETDFTDYKAERVLTIPPEQLTYGTCPECG